MEKDNPCLIFGASTKGRLAFEYMNQDRSILGFIDNDPRKSGSQFCGLPVMGLSEACRRFPLSNIVVASQYSTEITQQLIKNGILSLSHFQRRIDPSDQGRVEEAVVEYDFSCLPKRNGRKPKVVIIARNYSGSNTRAFYHLAAKHREDWNAILLEDSNRDQHYMETLFSADVVVVSHDCTPIEGVKYIQLWHGFPLKGLNLMSRYQTATARKRSCAAWNQYSAIASYSQTYSTLMNSCYGVPVERYYITGMPRNDYLYLSDGRSKLEEVLGVRLGCKRVVFYMPTFRSSQYGQKNGVELNSFISGENEESIDQFMQFLDVSNILLVVKLHPYDHEAMSKLSRYPTESMRFIWESDLEKHSIDFYEMLNAADALITDYSSVYFDYLLTGRPVVFFSPDLGEYAATRGFLLSPYEKWTPGPRATNYSSLQESLQGIFETSELGDRQPYEAVRDVVHQYTDAKSSERCASLIQEIMEMK